MVNTYRNKYAQAITHTQRQRFQRNGTCAEEKMPEKRSTNKEKDA